MANPIRFFLLPITILYLFNCTDNLFEDKYPYDLSKEEKPWLHDGDDDGVADSLEVYAKDCKGPIRDCLKTAQENKKKEEKRIRDSLELAAVDFSQDEGLFYKAFQVEITNKGDGTIRYDTNGAEPSEKSAAYKGPISITVSTELKARIFSKSGNAGPVKSAKYELKVKKPAAVPEGGAYTDTIKAMLVCETDETAIFYTLDGSLPSVLSKKIEDSLEISSTSTILARAMRNGWTPSDTLEVRYRINIPGIVVGPVFTPEAGTYHESQQVSISSETEGAKIFYTLNGTEPDSSSQRYSEKIAIDSGMTIQAMAIKEGMKPSAVAAAKYSLKPATPEFDPRKGDYKEEISVAITVKSPGGAEIYYTTDGQVPTDSSERYKDAILVNKSLTIKARAFYKNWDSSEVGEASYNINIPGEVPTPVFDPVGGTFFTPTSVSISTGEGGAKIYYTTNGDTPSVSASLFESEFTIYDNTTIMAIAIDTGGETSEVSEAEFTILRPRPDSLGPSISLVHPSWKDTVVFAAEVEIEVKADDPSGVASVKINGEEASLSEGKYTQTLTLSSGENKIVVMAVDESANQNQSADTLKITYDPPPDAVTLFSPTHITGEGMRITWSQNDNTDFQAYKIYYSDSPSVSTSGHLAHVELYRGNTAYSLSGLSWNTTYYVKVYVFDNNSSAGSNQISAFMNTAPVFADVPGQTVEENSLLSFTISATDADGNDLDYSMLTPSIANAEFDSVSKTFSWTPTYTDSGKYVAKFEVTDNALVPGRDTLLVDITVKNFNGDSLVVRNLLDGNGFSSIAVDTSICTYTGERITYLRLDSSRIHGQLTSLPAEIGNLVNLTQLGISNNQLSILPSSIGNLTKLESLSAGYNNITNLPAEIGNLVNLINLIIWHNRLSSLPSSIGNLTKLEQFFANSNKLTSLPAEIGNLVNLTELHIGNNQLSSLPSSIGNLTKLKYLYVNNNNITNLPAEIENLVNLTQLGISNNQLSILPSSIGNLTKLESLSAGYNNITNLPDEIRNLVNLTSLSIHYNQLIDLPSEIVNLTSLKYLDVRRNKLCDLSDDVKTWINTHSYYANWESTQSCGD